MIDCGSADSSKGINFVALPFLQQLLYSLCGVQCEIYAIAPSLYLVIDKEEMVFDGITGRFLFRWTMRRIIEFIKYLIWNHIDDHGENGMGEEMI
jgi:hypothetical protein